jgi:septal ring factor EnvC (AmiA/AmiB activator)
LTWATVALDAQAPAPQRPDAQRVDERLRALQRESDQLASQAETLLGELRKLEIERDLRSHQAQQAEAAAKAAQQAVQGATERVEALERERTAQLPDVQKQLVDIYKRGRGGYARLLFGAQGLRDFARSTRAIAALVAINERRIAEHRKTLEALASERATLEASAAELQARQRAAQAARAAAERAVSARAALITQIDSRRDLMAQYVGELQLAHERLQQQVAAAASGRTAEAVIVPLAPFRGALEWPVDGRVIGRFGQNGARGGGATVRNGIEIAVPENTPVRAVHGGRVGYAEPFAGFGNLVIVDHGGNNFSLYGYLAVIGVKRDDRVDAGSELGRAGPAPAGPPALYFEIRIDGRSVDPLQWLKAR